MKPPYDITSNILSLVSEISRILGTIDVLGLGRVSPELRRENRIKTIQSTLEIEGNGLCEGDVEGIIEGKMVLAPMRDILEVQNAIEVYEKMGELNPLDIKDLERAHSIMMRGLLGDAGKIRASNVAIAKGGNIAHIAPKYDIVRGLLNDLFSYLGGIKEPTLVKSCVFHYEFEFIHPFVDGNGRMGRFWQTLILAKEYPIFEYLPVENFIKRNQSEYYNKLSKSDRLGKSTPFIEFMLGVIKEALLAVIN